MLCQEASLCRRHVCVCVSVPVYVVTAACSADTVVSAARCSPMGECLVLALLAVSRGHSGLDVVDARLEYMIEKPFMCSAVCVLSRVCCS